MKVHARKAHLKNEVILEPEKSLDKIPVSYGACKNRRTGKQFLVIGFAKPVGLQLYHKSSTKSVQPIVFDKSI